MRDSQTCPKCRSRKLYVVDPVKQPDAALVAKPLSVTTMAVDDALNVGFNLGRTLPLTAGTFEAWICAKCGFTEWYAKEANEVLEILSKLPKAGVRLVQGEADASGPYR